MTDDHPVIILTGMSAECVRGIIEFIYQGEAYFPANIIKNVLDTAFYLKIAGLMEVLQIMLIKSLALIII